MRRLTFEDITGVERRRHELHPATAFLLHEEEDVHRANLLHVVLLSEEPQDLYISSETDESKKEDATTKRERLTTQKMNKC